MRGRSGEPERGDHIEVGPGAEGIGTGVGSLRGANRGNFGTGSTYQMYAIGGVLSSLGIIDYT